MKREWLADELAEHWTLSPSEREAVGNKAGPTRLGFAVLLKFFQLEGRFPRDAGEVPPAAIEYLAPQVGLPSTAWEGYAWDSRAFKYHRAQIREFLGFREATVADAADLTSWLDEHVLPRERALERVRHIASERYRERHIEPPAVDQLDRVLRSAIHNHEARFCAATLKALSPESRVGLDALLVPLPGVSAPDALGLAPLHVIASDPGRAGLRSIEEHVSKLELVRAIDLPPRLFHDTTASMLRSLRDRASVEEPFELRRHPESLRLTLLAAFCRLREQELADELVDLLIATVHRIGAKAEQRVEEELLDDLRRVAGKAGLLFRLAEVTLARPDDMVREVVYPVVHEDTLRALVKEAQASGPAYRQKVQTVIRNSYRGHYRRMVPAILRALDFRSSNEAHRPVIRALDLLKKYAGSRVRAYPLDEQVPIDGIVPAAWKDAVVEPREGSPRVDRIAYEVCTLRALRDNLRCKEVWVAGADRFRKPDEDLPGDFEERRESYYGLLKLPRAAAEFIARVRGEMCEALEALDRTVSANQDVRLVSRGGKGRISLSPLEAQPEPLTSVALKDQLAGRWPMTSLLDVLKETDLRVGFTDRFRSPTSHETLGRSELQPRVLLCLYGLGTNTGIKRMTGGRQAISYKDLLYVRRRFIGKAQLRAAIQDVVNAIFRVRLPQILGGGHDRVCLGLQEVRGLGPEPHDGVARPLRGTRRDDLLARRAQLGVHLLPAQVVFLIRGGGHDRGCAAPLHHHGGGEELRGHARPEHGGLRLLPPARVRAPPAIEGDPQTEAQPPRGRAARRLREPRADPHAADRLGNHRPAVRPDGEVHDRATAGDGGRRVDPAPLHQRKRPTPHVQGPFRTGPGDQDHLLVSLPDVPGVAAGDPRGPST